jgi:hypothetical protein
MNTTPPPGEAGNLAGLRAEIREPSTRDTNASAHPQAHGDVFLDFAVSLEEAGRRVKMLQQYIREHMTEGEDFGTIPGSNKPTLFRPGAEKLIAIFGLAPIVEITHRIEDWEKGFVAYEIKVRLINKRTGHIEAEGLGSCNSKERRYARQDAPSVSNTVLKIAKKRALVDATLSATRASGLFAQDLEDQDDAPRTTSGNSNVSRVEERTEHPQSDRREELSTPPTVRTAPQGGWSNDNFLTEAQHRAILAIASRIFGRPATGDDFAQLTEKPIEELTKSEASTLIDKMRSRVAEQQGVASQARNGRDRSYHRS